MTETLRPAHSAGPNENLWATIEIHQQDLKGLGFWPVPGTPSDAPHRASWPRRSVRRLNQGAEADFNPSAASVSRRRRKSLPRDQQRGEYAGSVAYRVPGSRYYRGKEGRCSWNPFWCAQSAACVRFRAFTLRRSAFI